MTILEALRDPNLYGIRVTCGDRWLVCNDDGEFVVYRRRYGEKKTRTLITTRSEDEAVKELLGNTREEQQ